MEHNENKDEKYTEGKKYQRYIRVASLFITF